jgi:hypothetical protein
MKRIAILVSVVALAVGSVLGFSLALGGSPAQTQRTYGPGWVNWAHVGPTQPIAQALSGIEGNVAAVYYLNPETGTFLLYVPSRPEVSDLTTMDFGQSYLMLLKAPTAMTIPTEATFLATPTSCPAVTPRPTATPCPYCLPASNPQSDSCASLKVAIEMYEILVDIAEQGRLVGGTETEVRASLAQAQQYFNQDCQGVPLAQPSFLALGCAAAGKWKGQEEGHMLYAPDAQTQLWINQFDNIIDKYCTPH